VSLRATNHRSEEEKITALKPVWEAATTETWVGRWRIKRARDESGSKEPEMARTPRPHAVAPEYCFCGTRFRYYLYTRMYSKVSSFCKLRAKLLC
jgi:hypothetical protein